MHDIRMAFSQPFRVLVLPTYAYAIGYWAFWADWRLRRVGQYIIHNNT